MEAGGVQLETGGYLSGKSFGRSARKSLEEVANCGTALRLWPFRLWTRVEWGMSVKRGMVGRKRRATLP